MIGKAIKYMRKKNDYKQEVLAKLLNVKCNTVSQYETENRQITFDNLEKIANKCGFDICFIDKNDNEIFKVKDLERKDL